MAHKCTCDWCHAYRRDLDLAHSATDAYWEIIQRADRLVDYLHAASVVSMVETVSNPANAKNIQDLIDQYLEKRGRR